MRAITTVWNICAAMALSLVVALSASATNIVFDTAGNIVGSYVGPKSVAADWVFSGGASGGATGVSAGRAVVPTSAGAIDVPTTVTSRWTAGRVAGVAVKAARVGSAIGTAFTAWEIYNAIKESGVYTCPPPAFFCFPSENDIKPTSPDGGWRDGNGAPGTYPTLDAVCKYYETSPRFTGLKRTPVLDNPPRAGTTGSGRCLLPDGYTAEAPFTNNPLVCPSGFTLTDGKCIANNPTLVPATDPQLTEAVGKKQASDPSYSPRLYDAARKDAQRNPGLLNPMSIVPSDLPIEVTTGPVTGPTVRTKTETIQNPDGTTSTRNTDQQTTITPNTSGTTISNTKVEYITNTTTTITTINNTTNQTTVEQITERAPSTDTNSPGQNSPETGPKECGSPGKPKCQIDELDTPTTKDTVKADEAIKKIEDDGKAATAEVDKITEDKIAWNWIPQIPTAACVDPQVNNPITGAAVTMLGICSAFNMLKAFISACFGFFCMVACVREVQAAIKA